MKMNTTNETFWKRLIGLFLIIFMIGCVDQDSLEVRVSDQSIVSLQDADVTLFEDETTTLEVTFVEPAKASGTIDLTFTGNGTYGTDFTTDPAGTTEGLSIPIASGDAELTINFMPVFKSGTVEEAIALDVLVEASGGVAFSLNTETSITILNRPEVFLTANLNEFAAVELESSASQNFTLGASGLESDLVITAPNNFELSLNDADFSTAITVSASDINVMDTLVYARFSPGFDSLGVRNGAVAFESANASTPSLLLTGTATAQPPTILVDTTPLDLGGTANGNVTGSQTVVVEGYRFTENVTAAVTGPFEVSLDNTDFSSSVDLDFVTLNARNTIDLFVRFAPTSGIDGVKNGMITLSSTGATDQVINLTGEEGLSLIAFTSFEEPTGLDVDYTDTGDSTVTRILENNDGEAPVRHTSTGGELGFVTIYKPTGGLGATDGDDLGVTTKVSIVEDTAEGGYTDGVQGYYADDTDGIIQIVFDPIDVSTLSILRVSLDYLFNDSSWEPEDYISVVVETGEGFEMEVLNLDGDDIEGGNLDEDTPLRTWYSLDADISNLTGGTVRLKIEVSTDSGAEEVYFDNIQFFGN